MNKLWILCLLLILACTPVLAGASEYESVPHTGPEKGMYESGGHDITGSFFELPLPLQIMYISGLLGVSLAFYKFLPLLFGKIKQNRKNPDRDRILYYITNNPGSTVADIGKDLEMKRSSVKYHLDVLRFNHKITLLKTTKSVLFFKNSYQYTDAEKKIVFCLRNDTRKSILHSILRKPGITNKDITEAFHLDKSTVHWHINELHNEELVHFNSDGKYKRCFINPAIEADLKNIISKSEPGISAS